MSSPTASNNTETKTSETPSKPQPEIQTAEAAAISANEFLKNQDSPIKGVTPKRKRKRTDSQDSDGCAQGGGFYADDDIQHQNSTVEDESVSTSCNNEDVEKAEYTEELPEKKTKKCDDSVDIDEDFIVGDGDVDDELEKLKKDLDAWEDEDEDGVDEVDRVKAESGTLRREKDTIKKELDSTQNDLLKNAKTITDLRTELKSINQKKQAIADRHEATQRLLKTASVKINSLKSYRVEKVHELSILHKALETTPIHLPRITSRLVVKELKKEARYRGLALEGRMKKAELLQFVKVGTVQMSEVMRIMNVEVEAVAGVGPRIATQNETALQATQTAEHAGHLRPRWLTANDGREQTENDESDGDLGGRSLSKEERTGSECTCEENDFDICAFYLDIKELTEDEQKTNMQDHEEGVNAGDDLELLNAKLESSRKECRADNSKPESRQNKLTEVPKAIAKLRARLEIVAKELKNMTYKHKAAQKLLSAAVGNLKRLQVSLEEKLYELSALQKILSLTEYHFPRITSKTTYTALVEEGKYRGVWKAYMKRNELLQFIKVGTIQLSEVCRIMRTEANPESEAAKIARDMKEKENKAAIRAKHNSFHGRRLEYTSHMTHQKRKDTCDGTLCQKFLEEKDRKGPFWSCRNCDLDICAFCLDYFYRHNVQLLCGSNNEKKEIAIREAIKSEVERREKEAKAVEKARNEDALHSALFAVHERQE